MKTSKLAFLAIFLGTLLSGQSAVATSGVPTTPSAASVIAGAEAKAASENKNVFVLFHASWCGWCHKLDDFLSRPEIAPLIDANYVTVHIVVQEAEDKKDLDNPGGDALLESLGGKGQGIPYYAILSPKNDTLAVSKNDKGQNIGYPGEKEEIPLFMKMLRTTSTHMSDSGLSLIDKELADAGKKLADERDQTMKLIKPINDAMKNHDYKAAYAACDELVASHPDKAPMVYQPRYTALLHIDEAKALSEIGQAMGSEKAEQADALRAYTILQEDSYSDGAYNAALSILLKQTKPENWYGHSQIAHAYARLHKMTEAVEFQEKAIEGAKAAKVDQNFIDGLVKAKADWQSKG